MDAHLNTIIGFIIQYGYIVIFPITIAEGPIITVIAGFLSAQGYFNLAIVYAVVVVGDLAGDFLWYGVGRFGHTIARSKIGKKIGIKDHHLDKVTGHYDIHSGKTLLLGKWTHSLGMFILTGAGVAKMPLGKFFLYNLIGTLPKSLLFTLLGYYVGYAFQKINSIIEKTAFIIGIFLIAGVIVYFALKFMKKKQVVDILSTAMVFGVFDAMHDGHRFFLTKATSLGDKLVVVVARDEAVLSYKGKLPLLNQSERMAAVNKEYPEAIVVLGDAVENSWKVIEKHQPNTVVLGYDQSELRERLEAIRTSFDKSIKLVTIEDHRGDELHSSLLRDK